MTVATKIKRTVEFTLPTIAGIKEFTPTRLMVEVIAKHIIERARGEGKEPRTITQLLVDDGHDRQNWYHWLLKPGFMDWWNKTIVDQFHTKTGLMRVYDAVERRACANSPQDAKTYLDRFDDDFKPQVAQEQSFRVPQSPEEVEELARLRDTRMAQVKQIKSKVIDNEAPIDTSAHNNEQDAGSKA